MTTPAWQSAYPPGLRWNPPIATGTLTKLLDDAVATYRDKPAFEFRERIISFNELGAHAARAAAGFHRLGVGKGGTVALYLPNTPYHPIAFFGALRTGARIAHLSPLDAPRELMHKLKDSGARTLVTTLFPAFVTVALKLLEAGLLDHVILADDGAWGPPASPPPTLPDDKRILTFDALCDVAETPRWTEPDKEDVAVLQYTGGTTGTPKGAMLTHANLTAAVSIYDVWASHQEIYRPGEETVIGVLPLFHIYALTAVLLSHLRMGNKVLLRARFDVDTTLNDIEVKRATAFPGVPTMWIALASVPGIEKRDLSSLHYCASGGAPMPVEVQQRFERLTGQQIGGGWGMTETSPAGTNIPRTDTRKPGTIGVPLPGITMDVVALDDPARVLKPGETGEIRIKGPNVFTGYWNKPAETKAAFVDGMFLTGDIGYMDEDGWFFLVDRKKDMIISGGFNVYPSVIENAIWEHPDVEEVIVIGVPDEYRGQSAKAFIRLRHGAERFDLDQLKAFLADKIGRHEMPAEIEFRDALPKTAVGKLSKKELIDEEKQKRTR